MWKSAIAAIAAIASAALLAAAASAADSKPIVLLNVSYDPTRELLRAIGSAFRAQYAKDHGATVTVKQSHGGSGSQARAVIDGLEADVVTLALWPDVDAIRKVGLIAEGWEKRVPNNSSPWSSTIVFVVRKGNPKGIEDWPDIVKPGIEIVTPNPKTSGNGKLSLLAAWGSVTERGGSEEDAKAFVTKLYKQAPVLDSAARGSTTTFAQKKIGDVHLTWENEAYLELAEAGGELELVTPPISILAEPPVALVDANVDRRGTRQAAEAYLRFLYGPDGQEIVAKNYYRPFDREVLSRHAATFKETRLFPVTAIAKDWNEVTKKFFADGAIFDSIYKRD
ncbi:MAG: sulfate ABC transporter substrate-binding protein [Candidatus Binatia bacterium]